MSDSDHSPRRSSNKLNKINNFIRNRDPNNFSFNHPIEEEENFYSIEEKTPTDIPTKIYDFRKI